MVPPSTVFSIEGKGLRLDSAVDLEPHIKPLLEADDIITEVRLGGNTFGVSACERLGTVLRSQKKLKIANLADIFTSRLLSEIPPALTFLLEALLEVRTLQTIDLSDNAFGLSTQAPLVDFLKSHVPLRHLILNNNGLGPNAGTLIAQALTDLCAVKSKSRSNPDIDFEIPHLETIVCGRNRLESGSMGAWARAIKDHGKGLRVVKMTQNGIHQQGIATLLEQGLRHASELEVLDLQDNTFTMLGSRALAAVSSGWPSLRELGVGDCILSARGSIKIAEALATGENKKLEILRFQYNEINSKGVEAIIHAAKSGLPALKKVELNGNKFDEDDQHVEDLRNLLEARKEAFGKEVDHAEWGLDELDELEEESDEVESEEGEESEAESDVEEKAERMLKETEEAEEEQVPEELDKAVDELGEKLKATTI